MARKLKSGIVGQAQVIFGGAIRMELGWVKSDRGEELAIGMAELKHPAAKAGDPINDEETYNGIQVSLVFPGFESLNVFRHILDLLEAELKKRIAERDAQQKIDFDDADPNHLVHEHIDPPAQGEQKPADKVEPKFKVGDIVKHKNNPHLTYILKRFTDNGDYEFHAIGKDGNEGCTCFYGVKYQDEWELVEQEPAWSEEDKRKIDRIYSILRQAADTHAFSTSCRLIGDKECIELQDFLKSLRDRVGCEANCTTMWKPNDAQMRALNDISITGCVSYAEQGQALTDLYNDLTKLKG